MRRGGALLHLFIRHVLYVRRYVPDMAERVFKAARAVTVELIRYGPSYTSASLYSLLYSRVNIFHVQR